MLPIIGTRLRAGQMPGPSLKGISTIKKAIETVLPATSVEADLASKLVSVRGSTDLTSIKALVSEAGYAPTAA